LFPSLEQWLAAISIQLFRVSHTGSLADPAQAAMIAAKG
jgi:hypothetical protein